MNPNDTGDKKEIVINKNHLGVRDSYTTLNIEAYAMPSSTYVPDDSHAFVVTEDRSNCWANYGRCWNDKGDRVLVAKQRAYKEWFLEFCPPNNYAQVGINFGVNGVCHTVANRQLLIGEDDVNVSQAPKNFVTVSVFGKYGFGLKILKQLITDSYNRALLKVDMPDTFLNEVLARIDNTMDEETEAWIQLIEEYIALPISSIVTQHTDALDRLHEMIATLLNNREMAYEELIKDLSKQADFEKNIYILLTTNLKNYIEFLFANAYISDQNRQMALNNLTNFFNQLFKIIDGQMEAVHDTGKLDMELAKK